jgi:acetate kinase
MNILVLNPGGNSLKAELVPCQAGQRYAFESQSQLSVTIEDIGKNPQLSILQNKKKTASEAVPAESYEQAAISLLKWWTRRQDQLPQLSKVDAIGIRVVHGGRDFLQPARIDASVIAKIASLEKLAPLHNKSSLQILDPLQARFPSLPIYAVFDTTFHATIPEYAASYGIPRTLAEKHQIRRYGFHGISHRYLLERYAHLAGKTPEECNIVSTHLESGCSITAVLRGRSIDNTMGLTPLEGLMMGTRSGDIDPSIVALLMREEQMTIDDVMDLLNKKSGLLGISKLSLDTRILMKEYNSNPKAALAMDIFAYRVRKAAGACIAALGSVDALVFGGGIAENGAFVRRSVCEGLQGFGLKMDSTANETLIDIEGRLSNSDSQLEAWVIPTQEGLQIAHECFLAISTT